MKRSIIIMGVSGCGKSTVGKMLAEALGATFYDGDDLHPASNIKKMASGIPLTDTDRQPWLEAIVTTVNQTTAETITACSALKKAYRDTLRKAEKTTFVYLHGSKEVLLSRLTQRSENSEHFMPSSLLDSQLKTLESPEDEADVITVSITDPPEQILSNILAKLTSIS